MIITVSGENKNVENGITIYELLKKENVEYVDYVSVSLNDNFITKENYNIKLNEGDKIEFVYFMGGGCDAF